MTSCMFGGDGRYRFSDGLVKEGAGLDGIKGHKERKVVLCIYHPLPRPLKAQDRVHRPCRLVRGATPYLVMLCVCCTHLQHTMNECTGIALRAPCPVHNTAV
jgi:hypothetical protein